MPRSSAGVIGARVDGDLSAQPILDEAPGDRIAARQAEVVAVLVRAQEVAVEPARILELALIHSDVAAPRAGVEAQHDRGGKRPGLRGMVGDLIDDDAGLLRDLARDRLFEALARL